MESVVDIVGGTLLGLGQQLLHAFGGRESIGAGQLLDRDDRAGLPILMSGDPVVGGSTLATSRMPTIPVSGVSLMSGPGDSPADDATVTMSRFSVDSWS